MTSSKFNHLPKAPSPNTITLKVRHSIYKFEGDTVQSIAVFKAMCIEVHRREKRGGEGKEGKEGKGRERRRGRMRGLENGAQEW